MLLMGYKTKKELRESVGDLLDYMETSMFGDEYLNDGSFLAAHRPAVTKLPGREFFAKITMVNGLIAKVE
jgi:hypothetical protein